MYTGSTAQHSNGMKVLVWGMVSLCIFCAAGKFSAAQEGEGEPVVGPVIESLSWVKVGNPVTHVEITFTLSHPSGQSCWVSLWGHDEVTRQHFPMQEFMEGNVEDMTFTPGTHTLTWVAEANAPGRQSDDFQVFLRVSDTGRVAAGRYIVIDVSEGAGAGAYPVTYVDDIDTNRDEYKTDNIVLRELPDGSYAGVFKVTQQQYQNVTGEAPSGFSGNPMRPVEKVSWNAITGSGGYGSGFIAMLRSKTGLTELDLPTSEDWEYTCRAGAMNDYNDYTLNNGLGASDEATLGSLGWYYSNSGSRTHDSGEKQPNAWGLYDTHGNVWEWTVTVDGSYLVLRGGYWAGSAYACRAGSRSSEFPSVDGYNIGFRLAFLAVPAKAAREPDGTTALAEPGGRGASRAQSGDADMEKSIYPSFVQTNTTAAILGLIASELVPVEGEGEPPTEGEGETAEGEGEPVEGEGEPVEGEGELVEGEGECNPDVVPPEIIECAPDIALWSGANEILPDLTDSVVVSDNCGNVEITQEPAPGIHIYENTVVTLTTTDSSGNVNSCEVFVSFSECDKWMGNLIGLTYDEALGVISSSGDSLGNVYGPIDGVVVAQEPGIDYLGPCFPLSVNLWFEYKSEGEGELPVEGEGEPPTEGEGETAEGEGEPVEGEPNMYEIAQELQDRFSEADENSDGKVTLVEAQVLILSLTQEQFAELDENGDGFLTLEEFAGDCSGCCRCNCGSKDVAAVIKKFMADWLLVGLSMLILLAYISRQKQM